MKSGSDGFTHFRQLEVVGDILDAGNGVQLVPGATGAGAQVKAVGDDTTVDLELVPKGLGKFGYRTGSGGAVTQITSAATGVTLNKACGTITTFALSAAAAGEHVFTVTNSVVAATDVVVACIKSYAGTGVPMIGVTAVAAGSFALTITNLDAAAALNALATINFSVIKGVAA